MHYHSRMSLIGAMACAALMANGAAGAKAAKAAKPEDPPPEPGANSSGIGPDTAGNGANPDYVAPVEPDLPLYRCHKVVGAAKVVAFDETEHVGEVRFETDHGAFAVRLAPSASPQVGGYVVRYADGYLSYSPAQAFEEGYTMVTPEDWPENAPSGMSATDILAEKEIIRLADFILENDLGVHIEGSAVDTAIKIIGELTKANSSEATFIKAYEIQFKRLANFIMEKEHVPIGLESAVDIAINLITNAGQVFTNTAGESETVTGKVHYPGDMTPFDYLEHHLGQIENTLNSAFRTGGEIIIEAHNAYAVVKKAFARLKPPEPAEP